MCSSVCSVFLKQSPKLVSIHLPNGSDKWIENSSDPTMKHNHKISTQSASLPTSKDFKAKERVKLVSFSNRPILVSPAITNGSVSITKTVEKVVEPGVRIKVTLPHKEVLALLDTGADISIIRADLVNPHKIEGIRGIPLITADTSPLEIMGTTLIKFEIDSVVFEYRFIVTKSLSAPLIIGNDFAYKYFESFNYKDNYAIILNPETLKPFKIATYGSVRAVAHNIQTGQIMDESLSLENSKYIVNTIFDDETFSTISAILDPTEPILFAYSLHMITIEPYGTAKIPILWKNRRNAENVTLKPSESLQKIGLELITKNIQEMSKTVALVVRNGTSKFKTLYPSTKVAVESCQTISVISDAENTLKSPKTEQKVLEPTNCLVNENLSEKMKESIRKLVVKYQDVFQWDKSTFKAAEANFIPQKIPIVNNSPIYQRPYRVSEAENRVIDEHVADLLKSGAIYESSSLWSAPLLLVKKKLSEWDKKQGKIIADEYRVAINFKKQNECLGLLRFEIPRIEDILAGYVRKRWFSRLDLFKFYNQIPLDPEVSEVLSFSTHSGHYSYRCLPNGVHSGPGIGQKLITETFRHIQDLSCFIDDINLATEDFKTHLLRLEQIFQACREKNLKLHPKKSIFALQEVDVFGFIINETGMCPNPEKCKVIKDYPRPKTVRQVRRFIGLINYYRKFLKNLSTTLAPLYDITKGKVKFAWGPAQEKAFNEAKNKLCEAPILTHFDPNLEIILDVDASNEGIGGILSVKTEEGHIKPVAYASKKLTDQQKRKLSVSEKEMLAITHFCLKFRNYIFGHHVTIRTDHRPLTFISKGKNINGTLNRMIHQISDFWYTIQYRKGIIHSAPDALSRIYERDEPEEPITKNKSTMTDFEPAMVAVAIESQMVTRGMSESESANECVINQSECELTEAPPNSKITEISLLPKHFADYQLNDPNYNQIILALKHPGAYPSPLTRKLQHYELKNGLLYRKSYGGGDKLMIPNKLRKLWLTAAHDSKITGAHSGFKRTLSKLQDYDWPTIIKDCKNYCLSCDKCQRAKYSTIGPKGHLEPTKIVPIPFYKIVIDISGPYNSNNRKKYVCSLVDSYTKFWYAKPTASATGQEVARFLLDCFAIFGFPAIIKSDNGPGLIESSLKELLHSLGIDHQLSPFYTPRVQSLAERNFRTQGEILRAYVADNPKSWSEYIVPMTAAYNITPHSTTKVSPHFLLFGVHPKLIPSPELRNECTFDSVQSRLEILDSVRKKALDRIQQAQKKMRENLNIKRKEITFRIGERVLIQKPVKKKNETSKLLPKFFGPYYIVARKTPSIYIVREKYMDPSSKSEQVHAEKMRRYYDPKFYRKSLYESEKASEILNPEFYDPDLLLSSEDEEADLEVS